MSALPANLPEINTARLPEIYEAAKIALAECARVDECRDWANRMEAIASYARQSEDETLMKHAMRIKARAIDRCGELLREIPAAKTGPKLDGCAPTELGRMQAASEAGLSRDQTVTALRVNNVPRDLFNQLVDSDKPPTIEKLAELGTQKRSEPSPDYLQGRDPADFEQATRLIGVINFIVTKSATIDLDATSRGLNDREHADFMTKLDHSITWLLQVKHALQLR